MDMMRLVVDNHDILQSCQIFQFRASQITAIQHTKIITSCFARSYRQQFIDDTWHVVIVFCVFLHLIFKQMPIGKCNQSITCGLTPYTLFLCDYIILYEREHFLAIMHRNKNFLIHIEIIGFNIAFFSVSFHSATECVKKAIIDDQARSHNQEVLGITSAFHILMTCIQHLPDQ